MYEDALTVMQTTSFGVKAVLMGLGAATGAFGFAAAIPSVLTRILPPPVVDELWTFLPFRGIAPDRKTIILDDNHYIQVVELSGAEINLASSVQRKTLRDRRKYWLDELEKQGVDHVKMFHIKQQVHLKRTLRSSIPLLRQIDETWETGFPAAYRLTHYVCLVVKGKDYIDGEAKLNKLTQFTVSTLHDFRPKVLEEPEYPDEIDYDLTESLPKGPLHPFAQVISPITKPSPYGGRFNGPLSSMLTADEIDFSKTDEGYIVFRNRHERKYGAVMTLRHCGEKTTEDIMKDLLALDCEMVVYHAVEPIEQSVANFELQRQKAASVTAHLSANAAPEYEKVIRKVEGIDADDRSSLCYYAMNVVPMCRSINGPNGLLEIQARIMTILTRTAGTGVNLANTAQPTWLSMSNVDDTWPRRFRFLTDDVAPYFYPQRSVAGMIRSPWANEPIAFFRDASGNPYPFNLHANDAPNAPAHAVVIGPPGTGKTTFLTFMAASATRIPRLRLFMLDRLQGMKIFTTCANGAYIKFDGANPDAAMNPLHLPDSPENRAFLRQWLSNAIGARDARDASTIAEVSRLITMAYDTGQLRANRTMTALSRYALSPTGIARRNIQPWIDTEIYGNLFNAPEDTLDLAASRIVAFDMTRMLNDEILAPVAVDYLMHRMQDLSRTTGDPSITIIDESAPMMANAHFANKFLDVGLQEGRKLKQSFILCFQTPQKMFETGKAGTIIANCNTQIFFRNPVASDETIEAYRAFDLNDAEMDFVVGKTFREMPYAALIKRQVANESSIVNTSLLALGNLMRTFQSGTDDILALEAFEQRHSREEAVHRYINRAK